MVEIRINFKRIYLKLTLKYFRIQNYGFNKVLVWDDMMRTADVDDLMILQGLVEPVVWNYGENLQFSPGMFQRYSAVFGSSVCEQNPSQKFKKNFL